MHPVARSPKRCGSVRWLSYRVTESRVGDSALVTLSMAGGCHLPAAPFHKRDALLG